MGQIQLLINKRSLLGDEQRSHPWQKKIDAPIKEKGYNCVYLPPYSPELDPIEQFWALVKNLVNRGKLLDNETLTQQGIIEVS